MVTSNAEIIKIDHTPLSEISHHSERRKRTDHSRGSYFYIYILIAISIFIESALVSEEKETIPVSVLTMCKSIRSLIAHFPPSVSDVAVHVATSRTEKIGNIDPFTGTLWFGLDAAHSEP